jgi:hypothetical protein
MRTPFASFWSGSCADGVDPRRVVIVIAGRQGFQTPQRDRSRVSAPDLPVGASQLTA